MHSKARRATDGISSVSSASVEPNRRSRSEERYDPRASADNSGTENIRCPRSQIVHASSGSSTQYWVFLSVYDDCARQGAIARCQLVRRREIMAAALFYFQTPQHRVPEFANLNV